MGGRSILAAFAALGLAAASEPAGAGCVPSKVAELPVTMDGMTPLVASSGPPLAYIEGDDFWRYLVKPRAGGPARNIRAIMPAMFRAAAAIAADDYETILDFSLPPAFVRRASARLADTPTHYVELRPALAVCASRAADRPEGLIAEYAPYTDFYAAFDAEERFVIRNDVTAPAEVAAMIRAGLIAGRFLLR